MMKKLGFILFVFLPFVASAQDTISSDKLLRILNDSAYVMNYSGQPFNGIQMNIAVFDWNEIEKAETSNPEIAHFLPKEKWPDTVKFNDIPNISCLNPYDYVYSFQEFNNGFPTGRFKSIINDRIVHLVTIKGKQKISKIYHFQRGDTVPGGLKTVIFWNDDKHKKFINYNEEGRIVEMKKFSTKNFRIKKSIKYTDNTYVRIVSKRKKGKKKQYQRSEKNSKWIKNSEQRWNDNNQILLLEYDKNGSKTKKVRYTKPNNKDYKNGIYKKTKVYN